MTTRTVVHAIAGAVQARLNCIASGNLEWKERHERAIQALVKEYLPSGSGFDGGTAIDLDKSNGDVLVFDTDFHHMNDAGMYTRWSGHSVIVRPAFDGISLRVTGRNYRDIKDYIAEVFYQSLTAEIEPGRLRGILLRAHT